MKYVLFSYWVADVITNAMSMLEVFAKKDANMVFAMSCADSIVIREDEITHFKQKWGPHKKREFRESDFIE